MAVFPQVRTHLLKPSCLTICNNLHVFTGHSLKLESSTMCACLCVNPQCLTHTQPRGETNTRSTGTFQKFTKRKPVSRIKSKWELMMSQKKTVISHPQKWVARIKWYNHGLLHTPCHSPALEGRGSGLRRFCYWLFHSLPRDTALPKWAKKRSAPWPFL